MSSKLNFIPNFDSYEDIRAEMRNDLEYRLATRQGKTSLGRPLYFRPNVQVVMTQECPYHCLFCLERKHPMKGMFNAKQQIESLKKVLEEHPNARLTITGGEPSLYPDHVRNLTETFAAYSNQIFCSINTAGYDPVIQEFGHINLSYNDYVHPDVSLYKECTLQTVISDKDMNLENIKKFMINHNQTDKFSFRFLTELGKENYNIKILEELKSDPNVKISTFRIGDFFLYVTFNTILPDGTNTHSRITLGDMTQQVANNYQDGYSNIIIHPDGRIGVNWK